MRDDFDDKTKEIFARRVGYRCSNPNCHQSTRGPQADPTKTINIGVAAHITAASPGGPRYDPRISPEERKSLENGIWLCQNCAKLVDNDEKRYSVDLLKEWKQLSEQAALLEIENKTQTWRPTQSDDEVKTYQTPKLILKLFKMDRDYSHQDEISLSQANRSFPQNHMFGFALENTVALTMAKGIHIRVRFANRTDTRIAPRFEAPCQEGWTTQVSELVMEQEAILTFRGSDLVCLHRHPVEWNNFKLTLWEPVKGYILISYDITSIQPQTESDGQLKIHLI